MVLEEGVFIFFQIDGYVKFSQYRVEILKFKNKEMKELFDVGFGIYYVGMLRIDRNMMEKMFGDGCINVLCCILILVWGVNFLVYVVIIKGIQVYDIGKGLFMDFFVLDVF